MSDPESRACVFRAACILRAYVLASNLLAKNLRWCSPSIIPESRATVGYPSGQRGQTVNLLAHAFDGSNPSPTTTLLTLAESLFIINAEWQPRLLDSFPFLP